MAKQRRGEEARGVATGDLRWVVCPVCRGALALADQEVVCGGCGRQYPVVEGIPVLLAERVLNRDGA